MPDKSGLPSGARGVRAVRLGFPSAVFGTPAVGYFNHWAPVVTDQVRAEAAASAASADRTMDLRMINVSTKTSIVLSPRGRRGPGPARRLRAAVPRARVPASDWRRRERARGNDARDCSARA